ncbi:MAG: 4-hydroxy-tetrahydrodipicolinate synthase [Bacteroidetes bacterium]|nr:4-hydroxy-tetrahydrodipicolinate synthase [Bacteroidota bacterium]
MDLSQTLRGTGVAIITPFRSDKQVDFTALGRMIDFIIAEKAEYIVTLGTTGESPVVSKEEKVDIIRFTYDRVAFRVPVVVGVGGNDTNAVVKELQSLPLEKATAVLSASPYYNKPSQEGLFQHYRVLAESSSKPILLYNVPGRTGRGLTAATTLRIAREVKNIAGIKEASGDMQLCMELLRDKPEDFLVVSGDDALALPQIACGMSGVISVVANAFPGDFSNMVRLCLQQDFTEAKKINDRLMPSYDLMFSENNPAGIKAFLYEMGMIENEMRLPLVPVSDALQEEIKTYLRNR